MATGQASNVQWFPSLMHLHLPFVPPLNLPPQVVAGILAVKMFAWESPFTSLIQSIRNQERRT